MKTTALVIPCRNEYARLRPEAFFDAIAQNPSLTFIFVDDGSTDRTDETLAFLERASAAIKALYLSRHQGKAEAVRTGVNWALAHTSADFIGFWDADLATPLSELSAFVAALAADASCWAAIGSRWPHLGARVGRSGGRGLAGAVMHTLIRTLARLPVYDTQCGAKLFRRDLAARVFARPFFSRWLFDVELLKRIPLDELRRRVREIPLEVWRDVPGSKLRLTDMIRSLVDLVRIVRKARPAELDEKRLTFAVEPGGAFCRFDGLQGNLSGASFFKP